MEMPRVSKPVREGFRVKVKVKVQKTQQKKCLKIFEKTRYIHCELISWTMMR